MIQDNERRLVQVASLINTLCRAEGAAAWAVFDWLIQQSQHQLKLPRLHMPGRTAEEAVHHASADESIAAWQQMATQAKRRRVEATSMPTQASSWFVHVDDVEQLVKQRAPWTDAAREALRQLCTRYRPQPAPRALQPSSPAGDTLPPPPVQRDRGRKLKKSVLVDLYAREWWNIMDDFDHASKNGLREAAFTGDRGYWWELDVLEWARMRGRLPGLSQPAMKPSMGLGWRAPTADD